jgi:hypothetical protein
MTANVLKLFPRVFVVLLVAYAQWQQAANAQSYLVSVDTSSVESLAGFLDFQFNPSVATAPAATADVQFTNTFDTLFGGAATVEGDVSVAPPSLDFSMGNSAAFNDWLQPVSFGSAFSFVVSFGGDFLTAAGTDGTAFSLTLLADDLATPLLTTDGNGTVATMDLRPGGLISISTFPRDLTTSSVVTVTPVPEAHEYVMLLAGLAVVGAWVRSQRRAC